ncbi:chromosome segregation ATPase [Aliinostoc sp. HNIBRCY26]|uniref:chromosome segregation ATPase n=1 Tax=Aliinostoc sp. HNIBRCY26 TaxID=3418997 RepID=UPI003D054BBD
MPPSSPVESSSPAPINSNWYLLNVRSKKRESFLKYLNLAIKQNNLQELILDIKIPQDAVYEDIVLLNLSNFNTANSQLQKIDHFQSLQRKPLTSEQVRRMVV